jgi:hypothetical protein
MKKNTYLSLGQFGNDKWAMLKTLILLEANAKLFE